MPQSLRFSSMRALKYLAAAQIPLVVFLSLQLPGWWSFLAVGYAYGLIPVIDQLLPRTDRNMDAVEEETARQDRLYDWMLYLLVPVQVGLLISYLSLLASGTLTTLEVVGTTLSMSISGAVLGINLAHELGHRTTTHERFMAKTLLLTVLNMHFIVEHNLGHHKRVGTPDDPATGRLGETVYRFVPRSMVFSFLSAWGIERDRRASRHLPFWSPRNEMLQMMTIQSTALLVCWIWGGWLPAVGFLASGLLAQMQLELINYIEHYGLSRARRSDGRWERVQAHHSWNSNHAYGRLVLFELTRHSDHHYMASRPYQVLRHLDEAPQMPAGYPAMMLLSLLPPAWFRVMDPKARETMDRHYAAPSGQPETA